MRTLATFSRAGVLAAGVGALLFTGVAAQGTATAAPQGQGAKLTVKDYRAWLMNNDEGAAAIQTLKAFDKLPKAKQQKFVDYLQNRAVTKAFQLSFAGGVAKGNDRVVTYNKDVSFTGVVKGSNKKDPKGGRNVALTFTATERIYNIPVVTQKVDFRYKIKNASAVSPVVKSSVVNLNRAYAIKAAGTKVSGKSTVTATVTWKWAPQYKTAGTATVTKKQGITSFAGQKFGARLYNG